MYFAEDLVIWLFTLYIPRYSVVKAGISRSAEAEEIVQCKVFWIRNVTQRMIDTVAGRFITER